MDLSRKNMLLNRFKVKGDKVRFLRENYKFVKDESDKYEFVAALWFVCITECMENNDKTPKLVTFLEVLNCWEPEVWSAKLSTKKTRFSAYFNSTLGISQDNVSFDTWKDKDNPKLRGLKGQILWLKEQLTKYNQCCA